MQIVKDVRRVKRVVKRVWRGRRAFMQVRKQLAMLPEKPLGHYRVGVYFADSDVNIYQMQQWYAPLRRLNKLFPVLILARNALGARALMADSELAVAYVPKVTSIENLLAEQPLDVILYVNQNAKNFQMLRYGSRWHVFINHGESDKIYMSTNQHKCYDYALVAGTAAQQRLSAALWNYPVAERTIPIGRPQTDHLQATAPYPQDERITVLYAPTWEGDRPAATYGSIASHGEKIVQTLLATGKHRVVYRPHPRSGVADSEYAAANKRIKAAIAAANVQDATACHIVDSAPTLNWQLAQTDIAICDVSAMVYDRLATGKPLMVTAPVAPEAEVEKVGYLAVCDWLAAAETDQIVEKIAAMLSNPEKIAQNAKWAQHYFGDISPGAQTARFEQAITDLLASASTQRER